MSCVAWFPEALIEHFRRLGLDLPPDPESEEWKATYGPWMAWIDSKMVDRPEFDRASERMAVEGYAVAYAKIGRKTVRKWFPDHLPVLQAYLGDVLADAALAAGGTALPADFPAAQAAARACCRDPHCGGTGTTVRYTHQAQTNRAGRTIPAGTAYSFFCDCPAGRWLARYWSARPNDPAPARDIEKYPKLRLEYDPASGTMTNPHLHPPAAGTGLNAFQAARRAALAKAGRREADGIPHVVRDILPFPVTAGEPPADPTRTTEEFARLLNADPDASAAWSTLDEAILERASKGWLAGSDEVFPWLRKKGAAIRQARA